MALRNLVFFSSVHQETRRWDLFLRVWLAILVALPAFFLASGYHVFLAFFAREVATSGLQCYVYGVQVIGHIFDQWVFSPFVVWMLRQVLSRRCQELGKYFYCWRSVDGWEGLHDGDDDDEDDSMTMTLMVVMVMMTLMVVMMMMTTTTMTTTTMMILLDIC